MATELTTPITRAALTHQGITSFKVQAPHKRSVDGTDAVLNKDKIEVRYEVTSWDEDGNVVFRASRTVPFANWTAGFKTDMNSVYSKLTADAKNNGLIGAGTDEDIN